MLIKITGQTPELFNENLTAVLNIASVIAMRGYIPSETDQANPQGAGRYWYREAGAPRYQLFPSSNDYWANVRHEGENYIVLEFSYRYDRRRLCDVLAALILVRFPDVEDVTPSKA